MSLAACLLVSLTGCLSPDKKVAHEIPSLHNRWEAEIARQSSLPERTLDWPAALDLLRANNLKLRAARFDITNSQELATQVFRDLIPTINLRSGVSRSLKNLPMSSLNDVTFNIDSFFNVPGVVNFDARLFAGRLAVIRAKTAYQLSEREQTIELYKLFLEMEENDELAAELKSDRLLADAVRKVDELSGQVMLKDVTTRTLSLDKSRESLQAQIGSLLANQQFHWTLATNGLPQFNYEDEPLLLADTNRVAQLQTRLVALELVRAWSLIHGIKLQYWPELTIFISGPSVFQRVNGQSHFWSSSDVTASADFFWSIDTRGYVSQQLRQTRREQDLEAAQLQLDSVALIDRLLSAQRLALTLRDQIAQLDHLAELVQKLPLDAGLASILQSAESRRSLRYQRFKLRRDLAEVNTLFWFVDEQQWNSPVP